MRVSRVPSSLNQASKYPRWPCLAGDAGKLKLCRKASGAVTIVCWPGRCDSMNKQFAKLPSAFNVLMSDRSHVERAYAAAIKCSISRCEVPGSQS